MVILGVGLFVVGCAKEQSTTWDSFKEPKTAEQLKQFVSEKEAQANAATNKMPSEFKTFFAAAKKGDWLSVSNDFENMRKRSHDFDHPGPNDERLQGVQWQAVKEVWGGFCAFCEGDEKYCASFSRDIINSIPTGSIYFGGTDPGRFLITAMQKSHVNADPFFTLTQNALTDGTYLDYLYSMYGNKIYVPAAEDLTRCIEEYKEDLERRAALGQLQPGEGVKTEDNRMAIAGQVSVMKINGLLTKIIFDKNPDREFYIEVSFPLDWMYPYLEPHGLIFKLNRQPLPELSDEIIRRDHDYWTNCIVPIIGDWLNDDTTIGEIAAFAEKVYVRHDVNDFSGDPRFVRKGYWLTTFSTERCAIAELYAWRAQHAASDTEKKRMQYEADFAFRQGWALCPISPEAVYRYVNLLASENRMSDAILVVETALKMPQMEEYEARQVRGLLKQLEQMQQQQSKK